MALFNRLFDKKNSNGLFEDEKQNTLYGGITQNVSPVNKVQAQQTSFNAPVANAVNNEVNNQETNKTADDILGLGQGAYNTYGNLAGGSGSGGGGGMGWIGIGQSAANGMGKYADSGEAKDIGEGFFGFDSEEDSDVMQALKGSMNGAKMGSAFGPWGAVIGGVAGLGYSFLDDI